MKNKKNFLSNPGLMVLSFILAITLWLVVANVDNPVTTKQFRDVDVTILNENVLSNINKVYEVVSGAQASFTVKGRRSVLDNMTAEDFRVVADLAHMSEVYAIPIEISPKNEAVDVEIYKNENTMVLSLEDELTDTCAVTVVTEGEVMDGYAIGEKEVKPNIVSVTGPQSMVHKIKEARVTVDVEHASSEVTDQCEVQYYDGNGELLDQARLSTDYKNVDVTVQVLKTKSVSVVVNTTGTVAKGYDLENVNYEPQTIDIAGTSEVLASVNEISINDVDISGLKEDTEYSFKVADYVPEGVVLTDAEQKIMVTVKVGQIISKDIILTGNYINLAGGQAKYKYELAKDVTVKVKVTGYRDVITSMQASDLDAMVDVSKLTAGDHLCTVSVRQDDVLSAVALDKVKVKVNKMQKK